MVDMETVAILKKINKKLQNLDSSLQYKTEPSQKDMIQALDPSDIHHVFKNILKGNEQ